MCSSDSSCQLISDCESDQRCDYLMHRILQRLFRFGQLQPYYRSTKLDRLIADDCINCPAAVDGRGEKSTNFVAEGYPLDGFRHKISDAQYELESPSKQEKAIIREMRALYTSGAESADGSARL